MHIYAGGVAADVSSQPALPISKNNLGRLDTRLLRALYEIPLSAFLNAQHLDSTKANQGAELAQLRDYKTKEGRSRES